MVRTRGGDAEVQSQFKSVFRRFDPTGEGRISRQQLSAVIRSLCINGDVPIVETNVDAVLREFDKNGDGHIDYGEFCQWIFGAEEAVSEAAESLATTWAASRIEAAAAAATNAKQAGPPPLIFVLAPPGDKACCCSGRYELARKEVRGRPAWKRADDAMLLHSEKVWTTSGVKHVWRVSSCSSGKPGKSLLWGDPAGSDEAMPHELLGPWRALAGKDSWREDSAISVSADAHRVVCPARQWRNNSAMGIFFRGGLLFCRVCVSETCALAIDPSRDGARLEAFQIVCSADWSTRVEATGGTSGYIDMLVPGSVLPVMRVERAGLGRFFAVEAVVGSNFTVVFDPSAMTVACLQESGGSAASINGMWNTEDGLCNIVEGAVHWFDGEISQVAMVSRGAGVVQWGDEEFQCQLESDGRLLWDDGNAWTRQALPKPWQRSWSADHDWWSYDVREQASGVHGIPLVEERAMSLQELRDLYFLIQERCVAQRWLDDHDQVLRADQVTLYHLNQELISPSTMRHCVRLRGLRRSSAWRVGEQVLQVEQGAKFNRVKVVALVVEEASACSDEVCVSVRRGRFKKLDNRYIEVGGEVVGQPRDIVIQNGISYKELVSPGPLKPTWFCSHWWGECVADFVIGCEEHATRRKLSGDAASYWVCAYANRQHDLGADIADSPDESSFRRAMLLADGVLAHLDAQATPFRRIWCCFELYRTLLDEEKLLDIISVADSQPRLLTIGPLPGEFSRQKTRREGHFPIELVCEGLHRRLEEGKASREIDKVRILNSMVGRLDSLDDASVLTDFEKHKHHYDRANNVLHAHFAVTVWPQAVERGSVQRMNLPSLLKRDVTRQSLALDFHDSEILTDGSLQEIADVLPSNLQRLNLVCSKCTQLSDAGVQALASKMPIGLRRTLLRFGHCSKLTNASALAIAGALPVGLEKLYLSFKECPSITDAGVCAIATMLPVTLTWLTLVFDDITPLTEVAIKDLAAHLPPGLERFELSLNGCDNVTDGGLSSLAEALPSSLTRLELYFANCKKLSDEALLAFAQHLPPNLEMFTFIANFCNRLGDAGLLALAPMLPRSLRRLEVRLRDCSLLTDAALEALWEHLPQSLLCLTVDLHGCRGLARAALCQLARRDLGGLKEFNLSLESTPLDCRFASAAELHQWLQSNNPI